MIRQPVAGSGGVDLGKARDALGRHAEAGERLEVLVAGAAGQDFELPVEEPCPDLVIGLFVALPRLFHDRGGVNGHDTLVGDLVFDATRLEHGKPSHEHRQMRAG